MLKKSGEVYTFETPKAVSRYRKRTTVSVAGPIGVGKTAMANVMEKLGYVVHRELVETNPFLVDLYEEIKYKKENGITDPYLKSAFPLQIALLKQRLAQILAAMAEGNLKDLFDRSIYEDCIFVLFFTKRGQMTEKECNLYLDLFWTIFDIIPHPDILLYCKASPEQCWKRKNARNIGMEEVVDLDYMTDLCAAYDEFFGMFKGKLVILEVDMNEEYDVNGRDYRDLIAVIAGGIGAKIEKMMDCPYEQFVF
jgi:deoxyguanosine kinase